MSGATDYKLNQRNRRINVRLQPLDYGHSEEATLSPSQRFRVEAFLPVIDQFVASLDQRASTYDSLSSMFGFINNLYDMKTEDLEAAAQNLIHKYENDVGAELVGELVQFAKFAEIFKTEGDVSMSTAHHLYTLLHRKNVVDTFPNVEIILRIYLSLMVANCSGERSFSKLKLIKNRLRSTMGNERLNFLSILSIEHDILRTTDFSEVISNFASRKSRKVYI